MAQDIRESRSPVSGVVEISPENDSFNEVLDLRVEETLAPEYIKVQYSDSASDETHLTVNDRDSEDSSSDSGTVVDEFLLQPGDTHIITDGVYDDVVDGIHSRADGDNNGVIVVTVGGMKITG